MDRNGVATGEILPLLCWEMLCRLAIHGLARCLDGGSIEVLSVPGAHVANTDVSERATHDVAMVGERRTMPFSRAVHIHVHFAVGAATHGAVLAAGEIRMEETSLALHLIRMVASVGGPQNIPCQGLMTFGGALVIVTGSGSVDQFVHETFVGIGIEPGFVGPVSVHVVVDGASHADLGRWDAVQAIRPGWGVARIADANRAVPLIHAIPVARAILSGAGSCIVYASQSFCVVSLIAGALGLAADHRAGAVARTVHPVTGVVFDARQTFGMISAVAGALGLAIDHRTCAMS